MDYEHYMSRVRQVAQRIQGNKHFRPLIEIERPFTAAEFSDLEESIRRSGIADVRIWKEFRDFYAVANGFLFQWLYQGPEKVARRSGSAQIAMVQEIYLPEKLPPARAKQFYGERRVLDRMSPDDQVAVRFQKGSELPELHYFSDRTGDYHPLALDFQQYLETMLAARAMYRWQEFFVADPGFPLSEEDQQAFRQSLQTLFPGIDVARFKRHSK